MEQYSNIPPAVIKLVEEQTNTSRKEKDEILRDLDLQYVQNNKRRQQNEDRLKNDPLYRKIWSFLDDELQ